jgi:hypothetical protein
MTKKELPIVSFKSAHELRVWLAGNHATSDGIWLRIYKKNSGVESVTFGEVLDEGLCFGWSESKRVRGDEKSYLQRFTPRRTPGTTSVRNKKHIEQLIREKRMMPSGFAATGFAGTSGEETPLSGQVFPVREEYTRCVHALTCTGILTHLAGSGSMGVTGAEGYEYPLPTRDQVTELFDQNREFVERKILQGFDRLELTPMAMPALRLADLLAAAIIRHGAEGKIFQTRRSPIDPFVPVRVNKEKHVWVWETLRQALDTDGLVYFPQEYSGNHQGLTKPEIVNDGRICAVPGWSIGLVESLPVMPEQGRGLTIGGRKQLEIGLSPREYLATLKAEAYEGETGRTLEDFLTTFLIRLETTNEVSNDINDNNAHWCLGQYMKIPYAEVVPTGRWHRDIGRVRLDMHRTGNKLCTKRVGAATTVRLGRQQGPVKNGS